MKYKVGDKVKIVAERHGHEFKIGSIVTITDTSPGHGYYLADGDSASQWAVEDDELAPAVEPSIESLMADLKELGIPEPARPQVAEAFLVLLKKYA